MALVLAQTFVKQLRSLPARERGLVSSHVLELQCDPTAARHSLHRVDGNAGWWSAYVNGDLRIILRREGDGNMVLCWTDHHDAAYLWARRHQLTQHPVTGAMQLVEIPEVTAEAPAAVAQPAPIPRTPPCARLGVTREELLSWGVPEVWVARVLEAASEDELLDLGEHHLPPDAAEAVLALAVGERPSARMPDEPVRENEGPRDWDARNWWVVSEDQDLKAALENTDWDSWCIYLHPSQRRIAYRTYDGPFRVCGSAGTGKTVVALHHAKHVLEQDASAQVLVVTYSSILADDLRRRCRPLMGPRALERCEARSLASFARMQFDRLFPGHGPIIHRRDLRDEALRILEFNHAEMPKGISPGFVLSEFMRVVEPRQLADEDSYLKTIRRGVHTRLSADRRRAIWKLVRKVYDGVNGVDGCVTVDQMFGLLAAYWRDNPDAPRFHTHLVVDECQDLCEVELDFLVAYMGGKGRLFFAGDVGQRIIRFAFPWKAHGVDLRGRSRVLKVNYRTTHQIRAMADRLTDVDASDADDIRQDRRGTVSLLSGPKPEIRQFGSEEEEIRGVAAWLDHLSTDLGIPGNAVAVFYRSENERGRAEEAVRRSVYGMDRFAQPTRAEMFEAKGLEYRAAVVMACDNDVIPSPERLAEADLIAGLEEIYDTERNLLYVACTRARDYLLVTSSGVPSELLMDMAERS